MTSSSSLDTVWNDLFWQHFMRVVDYTQSTVNKFQSLSITIWCNVFPLIKIFHHIRLCFLYIFDQSQSLFELLSQSYRSLSTTTFISKVLEHQESLLAFICIMRKWYFCVCHRLCSTKFEYDDKIYLSLTITIYFYQSSNVSVYLSS